MPFYGPLFYAAIAITKDWLFAWSVLPGAVLTIIGASASVLVFEIWPSREQRLSAMRSRVVRIVAEAVIGIAATLGVMFLISLVYYAPDAVLEKISNAATSQQRDADHKQWLQDTETLRNDLLTAQQGKPSPAIGVVDPKLTINHQKDSARLLIGLKNFSASSTIENIADSAAVMIGIGKQQETVSLTESPNLRLNPLETHHLEVNIHRKEKPNPYVKLYDEKAPLSFQLNLYFTANGQSYTQREVWAWIYGDHPGWVIADQHLFSGSVPLPAGIDKTGQPIYWSAPWLPPVACPPTDLKAKKG
jgi:hypothetical protein